MTVHAPIPDFAAARARDGRKPAAPAGRHRSGGRWTRWARSARTVRAEQTRPLAYVDRALAIGDGRFLPAPAVLGQLLTQMMPERGQRALVVGAGTGYSAAVLAAIGLNVIALEVVPNSPPPPANWASTVVEGAARSRSPDGAPYDQILIDGAVEFIPDAIIAQLAEGGRLGAALIDRGITRLVVGRKAGGAFGYLSIGDAGVAALPGFSRPKEFIF